MLKFLTKITTKIKPPGFFNLSIYDVAIFFGKGLTEGAITTRASSLAFNFFLAFFPAIIVLLTLIPYIPINGIQDTLIELLSTILPQSTNEAIFKTLDDLINNSRGGLLSIGFILAVYFSTNGVNSLIEAFNSSYHIRESRPILKQRLLSLLLTVLLSIILITTISFIIFGKLLVNYLTNYELISINQAILIISAKWFIMSFMLLFGIGVLFELGPAIKKKWQIITPGSIAATILIIITTIGFNYYINNFSQYNKIYGSIGTLMIILLWIYFNSIILLTGFELNASISNAKKTKHNYNKN